MAHPKEFAEGLSIGIIMDGNGRWAKRKGLPRSYGHRAGADTLKRIVVAADDLGIKVLTVLVFLFAGTLLILGLGPEPSPGFTNWTIGDAPFVGGFTAMLGIFMVAGFSFQGTEMIGIAAGESEDPEKNVPRAVHSIFWRILIFYIGSILIILCIYPWNEVSYIGSPFVMTFAKVGISAAAGIINFVVLTAALSGCNSGMYSSGRMLYTLAQNGQAPKIFAKLSPTGVPRNSIAVTIVVLAIGVILNYLIPD